jgi:predicted HTH domain antitoxin
MPTQFATQTIEVPQVLFDSWKPQQAAKKKIVEAAVFELIREGSMSSGKAAELLGMSRQEVLDLMARRNVAHVNFSKDELVHQLNDLKTRSG